MGTADSPTWTILLQSRVFEIGEWAIFNSTSKNWSIVFIVRNFFICFIWWITLSLNLKSIKGKRKFSLFCYEFMKYLWMILWEIFSSIYVSIIKFLAVRQPRIVFLIERTPLPLPSWRVYLYQFFVHHRSLECMAFLSSLGNYRYISWKATVVVVIEIYSDELVSNRSVDIQVSPLLSSNGIEMSLNKNLVNVV